MMNRILFIQKIFKRQIAIKKARLQGLHKMWDKLQLEILMNAKNAKEDSSEAILADKLSRFLLPDVKRACLKQYLEACTYKHALAFF